MDHSVQQTRENTRKWGQDCPLQAARWRCGDPMVCGQVFCFITLEMWFNGLQRHVLRWPSPRRGPEPCHCLMRRLHADHCFSNRQVSPRLLWRVLRATSWQWTVKNYSSLTNSYHFQLQLLHWRFQGKVVHSHPPRWFRAVHCRNGTLPARCHHDCSTFHEERHHCCR